MTKLDYAKSRVYNWGHSPQTIFLVHDGEWYRRRLWKDGKTFGWHKWEVVP